MGSLKLNFCNILKMFFIVGLLVRLCSPLASSLAPSMKYCLRLCSCWRYCYPACLASWLTRLWWRTALSQAPGLPSPPQSPSVLTTRASKVPHLATNAVLNWCQYCSSGWRDSAYIYLKEFCDKMEMKGEKEKLTRAVYSHWSRLP